MVRASRVSKRRSAKGPAPATPAAPAAPPVWHTPWEKPFKLAGMGWPLPGRIFRRLPVKTEWPLPPAVDALAWNTAGLQLRFRTDSSRIHLRVKLRAPADMDHMTATGQCGFDLYLGDFGAMRYTATTRFKRARSDYEVVLALFPRRAWRTCTLNFPLYQGVNELSVGLDAGARLAPPPPYRHPRPVVIYGTSITQGGCASRPGMAFTNILSRRLACEFINLGFSGNGRGEPEVAKIIATLPPPPLFIMDFEANCGDIAQMRERLPLFLEILRRRWPRTKFLVLTRNRYARELYDPADRAARLARAALQRQVVNRRRRAGDRNIFFMNGERLLGSDFEECAVDGVHPTDLGFWRMAEGLEQPIRKLLH
jgi:hypothetical protein